MAWSWGYSPKVEKYIPLADFPADKYLIIAQQAIENSGWKLSHLSETGIIAYTGLSWQSYSEEISIRILNNFAIVKSECVGIQLNFTDYGKNDANLEKFFHEFDYVEYQLKDIWQERLTTFHAFIATQDDSYFEREPLTAKNKIKNVFYLFYPQKNYFVTPILISVNILYWLFSVAMIVWGLFHVPAPGRVEFLNNVVLKLGSNSRELVLSGQYWRLISHQFMHGPPTHLFSNMYALIYIGLMIENKLGSKKFIVTYLFSGICGGLVSLLFHTDGVMMGASGAIMGLFGASVALLLSKAFEKNASRALLMSTLIVLAIMLLNGLRIKRVDNAAHIGGLVAGFICAYILFNEKIAGKNYSLKIRYAVTTMLVVAFSGTILSFTPNYQSKKFNELKIEYDRNQIRFEKVLNITQKLPLDEKLSQVEEYGIVPWKENLKLVKQMEPLVLTREESLIRKMKTEIAHKGYKVSIMMYKDLKAENKEDHQKVQKALNDLINLTFKLRDTMLKVN